MECIKFTIETDEEDGLPVIAGTGSNATYTTIDMSKEAVEYGVDGLLLVTPYYNKATQKGLIAHYKAVAAEAKAPIIMYSVASRTGLQYRAGDGGYPGERSGQYCWELRKLPVISARWQRL